VSERVARERIERETREKEMELGVCDFHFGTLSEIGVFPISIVGTSSVASERQRVGEL
jgi:hypothetical protein